MSSDIEIARASTMKPIQQVGQRLDIPSSALQPYGHYKAKVDFDFLRAQADKPDGKLILVTAVTPTPAGEGKTTTTVGLGDGLNRIGKRTAICLREPSLGPCFGMKGGAAGGGYAQVVPMEDINLHFTGDFHAIGAAHNLLSALLDNHMHWDFEPKFDPRRVTWRRVVDMNDRSLRDISIGLGGVTNGIPRESGFDITVASEVMAVFCLADSLEDLQERLARIVVGYTRGREPIYVRDLKGEGAMTVLLRDAFMPNLVQTLENNPAFVHGGPFANIAHGCNSVMATRAGLKLADYVVTEAGFGADLGAEKFFDIKCRKAGLNPAAAVVVATARALKMHGGVAKNALTGENVDAIRKGCENLGRHLTNIGRFGVPAVVAINRFTQDTDAEMAAITEYCKGFGAEVFECTHWANGSAGTEALAHRVVEIADSGKADFKPLYPDEMSLLDKMSKIATDYYGGDGVVVEQKAMNQLKGFEEAGYGHLPVCMAKTQYSFSTDATAVGAPSGFTIPVREVRLSAGAGFVVAVCGEIMTMPGLPREPAANTIRLNDQLQVEGLF
ncbi:MAG: formate--tetrahydrofolate ligase [Chromatiales bacterium]|nr:formate--tetrahydrofolate ligase [Chromatiales bacterium]